MTVCYLSSIYIESGAIIYEGPQDAFWRVPVASIRIVGEFTTDSLDDGHFLALVTDTQGAWFQAPVNAVGTDQVLAALARHWNVPLALQLKGAKPRASRVAWPLELQGEEMFEFSANLGDAPAKTSKQSLRGEIIASMSEN